MLDGATPAPIQTVLDYGRSGVAIFFVISGFVIAYTTRNLGHDARDGLNFFVRRQVRLDPPYYLMLVLVVAIGYAERLVPNLDWLLFFGTISYSLYLVHLPIIDTVLGAGYKITGQSIVGAVVLYFVGGLLSIGAAWALQRCVERPAMQWSQRLKRVKPRVVLDSEVTSATTSV